MSEPKAGSWRTVRNRNGTVNIVGPNDDEGWSSKVALVNSGNEEYANLIAAAPDYAEAAREALAFLNKIEGHGYGGMADFEIARRGLQAAIAKAESR
jgi:hypothetical protein